MIKTNEYQDRRVGELSWTYRAGADRLVAMDFERPGTLTGADENRVRIRGAFSNGSAAYFVKVFKPGGIGRMLRSFILGHVARKEFRASRYLAGQGVPTPKAVAVGTGPCRGDRAVIIFEAISGTVPMRDLFLSAGEKKKRELLAGAAEITATLHRARFYHRDYHSGNILAAKGVGGMPLFWVIDLHRSSFPRKMAGRRGIMNIADILHSFLPALKREDISLFIKHYRDRFPEARWDLKRAERIIEKRLSAIEEKRLKSRAKRCFINSTEYFVTKTPRHIVYGLREGWTGTALETIQAFDRGEGRVIKQDKKATVALLPADKGEVCVKVYEPLTFFDRVKTLFGRSRGHVSWGGARGFSLRGIATPRHLSLVIKRRFLIPRAVYLIAESIAPALEMDRFIIGRLRPGGGEAIKRFAEGLGTVVGSMHRQGVYHRDLKATNIAVKEYEGGFFFSFLDLDAVSFSDFVSIRRRAKNLAQIYLSTPTIIDEKARKEFFAAYCAAAGDEGDGRQISRLVRDEVRGKSILFVSLKGDVMEDAEGLFYRLWGKEDIGNVTVRPIKGH